MQSTTRRWVSMGMGVLTGFAAGLIGVGGGEFRIPVLINVLRLPVRTAAGVNLLIGLCTVIAGVIRRWGQHQWSVSDLHTAATMAAASVVGATLGGWLAARIPARGLKRFICAYLILVGLWMIYEAFAHSEHVLMSPAGATRIAWAILVGFVIATLSGALGVAGGEMRIPVLLYLFALPIKEAGTISLMVSIPTVAAGAFTHRRLGHVPSSALAVAAWMGIGSIVGVVAGAALLPLVNKHLLKGMLGGLLLLATVRMKAPVLGGNECQ